jgi:hypothetical protein
MMLAGAGGGRAPATGRGLDERERGCLVSRSGF